MKRKISIGQLISIIGILILSIGLLLNSFELVSLTLYRIIMIIGVSTELLSIFFILKRSEF